MRSINTPASTAAGRKPGEEQGRHGEVRDGREEHHQQAGRDEDAHGRGGAHNRHGLGAFVALPLHGREQEGPQDRHIGRGGARNAREEDLSHHGDVGQPAPEVAHQGQRQGHQAARDAPGLHQRPGQEEQGDGQEHKIIDAGDEPLGEHQEVGAAEALEGDERGEPERHRQRGIPEQQHREPDEQQPGG